MKGPMPNARALLAARGVTRFAPCLESGVALAHAREPRTLMRRASAALSTTATPRTIQDASVAATGLAQFHGSMNITSAALIDSGRGSTAQFPMPWKPPSLEVSEPKQVKRVTLYCKAGEWGAAKMNLQGSAKYKCQIKEVPYNDVCHVQCPDRIPVLEPMFAQVRCHVVEGKVRFVKPVRCQVRLVAWIVGALGLISCAGLCLCVPYLLDRAQKRWSGDDDDD